MRYLITCDGNPPALTNWFEAENHFNPDINMVVYDLHGLKYTRDGIVWEEIQEDHL